MSSAAEKQPKPATARVARHEAAAQWQDFNDPPSPARAAAQTVTREALGLLLARLEGADDMLTADRVNPRAAALEALQAVIAFSTSLPLGEEGRFSRALELLAEGLASLPAAEPGEIFPPVKGWADRQKTQRHIQAHAAYAMGLLHGNRPGVEGTLAAEDAASAIADLLDARGFPFGERRKDKAGAVIAWAKGTMAQAAVAEYDRLSEGVPPVARGRDAEENRRRVIAWLEEVLDRAGYG